MNVKMNESFKTDPSLQRSHLQDILEHFMLPSSDKLYGDDDFIFQQNLAPVHTAKSTKSWFNDHGVTVLDWPANSPDLNPIENLWGLSRRRWETPDPTMQMTWRPLSKQPGLHYTWSVPQTDHLHAALMQEFMQKEAQPSTECIEMNIPFRKSTFPEISV